MRWNTSHYDGAHSFVTAYREALLDLLTPRPGKRIPTCKLQPVTEISNRQNSGKWKLLWTRIAF